MALGSSGFSMCVVALGLVTAGCPVGVNGLAPDPIEAGVHPASYDAQVGEAAAQDSATSQPDAATEDAALDRADPDVVDAHEVDAGDAREETEAGCGPLGTVANCSACGQSCDTQSGAPSCDDGGTCSYACNPGLSDCNAASAPDTDGCECATPGCCGDLCETAHSNGAGQTYYDCNPPDTYGSAAAMAACTAFANGDASKCTDGWDCNSSSTEKQVCYVDASNACQTYCWNYSGTNAGVLSDCSCPVTKIANWD
jgi:hypothetical protein